MYQALSSRWPCSDTLRALSKASCHTLPWRAVMPTTTKTTATDGDKGKFGHLSYSLSGDGVLLPPSISSSSSSSTSFHAPSQSTSSSPPPSFTVNPSTGDVRLLRPLDRDPPEGRAVWHLWVTATDGELQASMSVTINLKDVNDNAPHFPESHVVVAISEDAPQSTSVVQVSAVDLDDPLEGYNARLTYSLERNVIEAASGTPIFEVDRQYGLVTTAICCLDREKTQRYVLHVVATDGGGLKGTSTVEVEVSDINDEAPRFSMAEWFLDVREGHPPEQSLASLTVIDPDTFNDFAFRVSARGRTPPWGYNAPLLPGKGKVMGGFGAQSSRTSTVEVEVSDINDEAPRFSMAEWFLDVREGHPPEQSLASLTVIDPDTFNDFAFRLVPGSGHGWQLFKVQARDGTGEKRNPVKQKKNLDALEEEHGQRSHVRAFNLEDFSGNVREEDEREEGGGGGGSARVAELRATEELDYENPDHRKGFRFRVQVTDKGAAGWLERRRVGSAWVNINLIDNNDNTPILRDTHARRTVPEDAPIGTPLASFTATDADAAGLGVIHFAIAPDSDPGGLFTLDGTGAVRVAGGLDRESSPAHTLLIWASDDGVPPRTATATLTVTVTDVNDNPPFLSEPKGEVEVEENGETKMVTKIKLDDPDDWHLGHGPPFSLALDPRAPHHVTSVVSVEFDPEGDDGRGIGVVWVRGPLDREERRALLVPVVVGDAAPAPCTATLTLTLHVRDQNDNPLTPAAKNVTAHVLQEGEGGERVPLGRIFVKDPDEGAEERTYAWRNPPPLPGFSLHPATGHLDMSPAVPPGSIAKLVCVSCVLAAAWWLSAAWLEGVAEDLEAKVEARRPPLSLFATCVQWLWPPPPPPPTRVPPFYARHVEAARKILRLREELRQPMPRPSWVLLRYLLGIVLPAGLMVWLIQCRTTGLRPPADASNTAQQAQHEAAVLRPSLQESDEETFGGPSFPKSGRRHPCNGPSSHEGTEQSEVKLSIQEDSLVGTLPSSAVTPIPDDGLVVNENTSQRDEGFSLTESESQPDAELSLCKTSPHVSLTQDLSTRLDSAVAFDVPSSQDSSLQDGSQELDDSYFIDEPELSIF
ncbi:putative neural-cadherin 2 [Chionoecetes opilio]|uniref:Putative neural-cadherin 2 n=1 Tax=Chionoecetes opilio TaxID=41210 RepID=A0A8J5CUF8_CHIOP|nr:putative neural-cadherin 2 [Chionoecetes opilio]